MHISVLLQTPRAASAEDISSSNRMDASQTEHRASSAPVPASYSIPGSSRPLPPPIPPLPHLAGLSGINPLPPLPPLPPHMVPSPLSCPLPAPIMSNPGKPASLPGAQHPIMQPMPPPSVSSSSALNKNSSPHRPINGGPPSTRRPAAPPAGPLVIPNAPGKPYVCHYINNTSTCKI